MHIRFCHLAIDLISVIQHARNPITQLNAVIGLVAGALGRIMWALVGFARLRAAGKPRSGRHNLMVRFGAKSTTAELDKFSANLPRRCFFPALSSKCNRFVRRRWTKFQLFPTYPYADLVGLGANGQCVFSILVVRGWAWGGCWAHVQHDTF